jgi:hypothetical protein
MCRAGCCSGDALYLNTRCTWSNFGQVSGYLLGHREVQLKWSLCLTEHRAMKTYRGSIASRFLNVGARWRRVISSMSRPLYPWGKSPRYIFDSRMEGPQGRLGRGGERKNSFMCLKSNPDRTTPSSVNVLTELPRTP